MIGELPNILGIPHDILGNLGVIWSFFLLFTRYSAFFMVVPGIGGGAMGLTIRIPAIILLSYTSLLAGARAPQPQAWDIFFISFVSEVLFGYILGIVPNLIVSGVQMAGHLASTTMGLGAGQLLDPTMGASVSELSKLYGDLVVLLFLMLGGHHVAIYAVSGFSGEIVPGTFLSQGTSVGLFIDRTADIFRIGALVASPVIVALLLTQFVMGLISKAVPSVNIFIVSFPLTIGIGLALSVLALPTLARFCAKELTGIENTMIAVSHSALSQKNDKSP